MALSTKVLSSWYFLSLAACMILSRRSSFSLAGTSMPMNRSLISRKKMGRSCSGTLGVLLPGGGRFLQVGLQVVAALGVDHHVRHVHVVPLEDRDGLVQRAPQLGKRLAGRRTSQMTLITAMSVSLHSLPPPSAT